MHEAAKRRSNDDVGSSYGPNGGALHAITPSSSPRKGERRRHARRDVVCEQLVSIHLGANNAGVVVDLSSGGAAVISNEPIERSARSSFAVEFGQPTSKIEGTGIFVWVDSTGLNGGMKFDRLSPEAQQQLDQCLSHRPESFLDDLVNEALVEDLVSDLSLATFEPADVQGAEAAPEDPATDESIAQLLDSVIPSPSDAPADNEAVGHEAAPDSSVASKVITATPPPDPALLELQRLVERAKAVAAADGACIALKDNGGYRCKVTIGSAPEVGLPVNQERGLAAECIAGRHLVVCNDLSRDPRVDAATKQRLGFGSTILLPISRGTDLAGILAVFSERSDAFGEQAITRLQETASLIENHIYSPLRGGTKAAIWRETPSINELRLPEFNFGGISRRSVAVSAIRVCVTTLIAMMAIVGLWYVYELRSAPSSQPSHAPSMSQASQAISTPPQPHAAATKPTPENPQTQPPATIQEARKPAPSQPVASSTEVRTTPEARPNKVESQITGETARPGVTKPQPTQETTRAASAEPRIPGPRPSSPAAQKIPVETTPPQVAQGPSAQPAGNSVPAQTTPLASPTPASTTNRPAQPVPHVQVITDVLQPKGQTSGSALAPEPASKVEIAYPAAAVAARQQGSVILKVTVDRDGNVRKTEVLDGDKALAAETVGAVRQWRYTPYQQGGRPVVMELLLTVNFLLSP